MSVQAVTHVKARPLSLTVDTTSEEAFIAIVGACLAHAEANRPAVLDEQVEGVHQMRVAFRRLRSGLKIFRPLIPCEASAELVAGIRWLNGFLGPARDWDVFLEEGMLPVFARFPRKRSLHLFRARAEILRRSHHRSLHAALEEPRYPLLLRQFAGWLDRCAWRDNLTDSQRKRLEEPVLKFATPLLEDDYRRVSKRGEDDTRVFSFFVGLPFF